MSSSADGVPYSTAAIQVAGSGEIPTSALHFHTAQQDDVFALIKRFHYSHRVPPERYIQLIGSLHLNGGLFGNLGPCVAGAVFMVPATRWNEPVLELCRLVRHNDYRVPLTFLIRMCLGVLKRNGSDLIVSFADLSQAHHGGIYQAAGWHYHGRRDRAMDGLLINGTFIPGRTCNNLYGTRSPEKVQSIISNQNVEPHYDEGKHLYWTALGRKGYAKAERLSLANNLYPKPSVLAEIPNPPLAVRIDDADRDSR